MTMRVKEKTYVSYIMQLDCRRFPEYIDSSFKFIERDVIVLKKSEKKRMN